MRKGLLALAVVVAVGGGCGKSDEDKVRDLAAEWTDALADKDGDRLCDAMAAEAKEDLKEPDECATEFGRLLVESPIQENPAGEILNVDVDGDEARIVYDNTELTAVKSGDDWGIDPTPR